MGKNRGQQRQPQQNSPVAPPAAPPEVSTVTAASEQSAAEGGSVEEGLSLASGSADTITDGVPDGAAEADEVQDFDAAEDGSGVMVECPLKRTASYATSNISYLPSRTAQTLRDLADGLADQGAKLESGKPVTDTRDAIIWFAEQIERGRRTAEATAAKGAA
jgi:hypothetical protein